MVGEHPKEGPLCGGEEAKEGLCGGDEAKEGLLCGGEGAKEGLWGEGGVLGRLGSRLIIVAGRGGGELILRLLKIKQKYVIEFSYK